MQVRLVTIIALAALGCALAACGVADPYGSPARPRKPSPPRQEEIARALPPRRPTKARPGASARAAARDFALVSTNWTWQTLALSERERTNLAVDALRRQIAQDGAAARADTTLARDHQVQSGKVLAIDTQGAGAHRVTYVVVRETTTSEGVEAIGDSAIAVYRAMLVRTARGWLVSAWSPVE